LFAYQTNGTAGGGRLCKIMTSSAYLRCAINGVATIMALE
jgi:hypothetical protein